MRYSILGFSQEMVLRLQKEQDGSIKKLDVTDLLILRDVADFMNRSKIIKYTIDDKVYFSIQYSAIIEDLPLIGIKKQALSDRLDKMVFLGVLEKTVIKNQCGTFVAFRMGNEYEKLLYSCTSSELHLQTYSTTSHNTNNTNNSYTNKEIEDKSSIEKVVNEFVDAMYALYPTKCPKRNASLGKSRKDKIKIRRLLKTYSQEEIERVIRHEVDNNYGVNYMKNFSTFLNNFPDPNEVETKDVDTPMSKTSDVVIINGQVYK